jgi:hypothetical protein
LARTGRFVRAQQQAAKQRIALQKAQQKLETQKAKDAVKA